MLFAMTHRSSWPYLRSGVPLFITLCCGMTASAVAPVQFNRDIRPILTENCFACHGPDRAKRQADLRLDMRDSALAVLDPGHPAKSRLVARITSVQPASVMPPVSSHKSLTAAQRTLLIQWVKEGAAYQVHWAYIPPKRAAVPKLANRKLQVANPIDAFLLAALERKGIAPSPPADRRTLIRRVSRI